LTAVGDLAAVHQVNVTSDVNGRITEIMFTAGASVKAATPLVQLFDGPEQGRPRQLQGAVDHGAIVARSRQAACLAPVQPAGAGRPGAVAYDQAQAGIAKTEAIISQKLVRAPFDGELGVRKVEGRPVSDRGNADRVADRPVDALSELHGDGKGFRLAQGRTDRAHQGRRIPGRTFEGKITTIEPQIATDTRNIRVQATIANPDKILKPGMFASTTVVLPDKPAVVTVPETCGGLHAVWRLRLPDRGEEVRRRQDQPRREPHRSCRPATASKAVRDSQGS
jgi:multidrug efflux system membrane fusion protein